MPVDWGVTARSYVTRFARDRIERLGETSTRSDNATFETLLAQRDIAVALDVLSGRGKR
jgi:hypothetical protein